MKKIFFNLIMALAMVLSFASCDSDDSISIPKDQKQDVNLSMYDQIFGIRFACDGNWNTTISYADSEEADWLSLSQESGSGDGEIRCIVPSNCGDQKREATIKLTCGSSSITFKVVQNSITEEIANIDINDDEFDASKFGNNIPLGYGILVKKSSSSTFTVTKNQIFTFKNWTDDKVKDLELGDMVQSIPYKDFELKFNTATSIDTAFKSIKGNLKVDMSFAMFKLGLTGHMNLANKTTGNKTTTGVVAPYPIMNYVLAYDDVMDKYQEAVEDNNTEAQKCILSSRFITVKNNIEKAINEKNENNLTKALNKLDKDFGPVFCVNAEIGGSVNITSSMELSNMADTMSIGGKLAAGFSGAFKITGEVEVNYLSEALSKTTEYSVEMKIKGGKDEARNTLASDVMGILTQMQQNASDTKSMTNFSNQVVQKVISWSKGISADDKDSYTCTNITVAPIWNLFEDAAKDKIKEYFKNKYPNKSNGECPYIYNIQELADED